MSNHIQGTWSTDAAGGFPLDIHGADGQLVARVQPWASEGAAERIVACVNALSHLSTDGLEQLAQDGDKLVATSRYVGEARRERDELLAALKPFADIGSTGFKGSMFEDQPDSAAVLYHHETGKRVTLGDFKRAVELLAKAKVGEA